MMAMIESGDEDYLFKRIVLEKRQQCFGDKHSNFITAIIHSLQQFRI
jgi:hypothetical protein